MVLVSTLNPVVVGFGGFVLVAVELAIDSIVVGLGGLVLAEVATVIDSVVAGLGGLELAEVELVEVELAIASTVVNARGCAPANGNLALSVIRLSVD